MLATAKKKSLDIGAVLGSAKKTDVKKSSVLELVVDETTLHSAEVCSKYIVAKKDATTGFATAQTELLSLIQGVRTSAIRQRGYASSFSIPLPEGKKLVMSWKHQYSKIPLEAEDALRAEFGEEYDEYIMPERMSIKIKDSQYTEEGLTRLMSGELTADTFAEFCEVERWLEPTERYTHEYPKFKPERKGVVDLYIKQYTPAFKVK
jgi:hypothetical protein